MSRLFFDRPATVNVTDGMNHRIAASIHQTLKEMINAQAVSRLRETEDCVLHATVPGIPDEWMGNDFDRGVALRAAQ